MQADSDNYSLHKKKILIKAISTVVMELLEKTGKSGRKFSAEYEIGIGVISKLERNLLHDVKFSTVWKLANAFAIPPNEFIKLIEKELPKGFNFYD